MTAYKQRTRISLPQLRIAYFCPGEDPPDRAS